MTSSPDVRPAARQRAPGSAAVDSLAGGGFALLLDRRDAPRAFLTVLCEHADQRAVRVLESTGSDAVRVAYDGEGGDLPLPDGVADVAVQLARLAGGCGGTALAPVDDLADQVADVPTITLAAVGRLVDDAAVAASRH
jgi:hypothetical protein